jgi:hypothetical protein
MSPWKRLTSLLSRVRLRPSAAAIVRRISVILIH